MHPSRFDQVTFAFHFSFFLLAALHQQPASAVLTTAVPILLLAGLLLVVMVVAVHQSNIVRVLLVEDKQWRLSKDINL